MGSGPYYIYILTNKHNTTFYTGVTNDLLRRVREHKARTDSKFTQHYNLNKLVYFELYLESMAAINREKQIKSGSRQKKIALIESLNPDWEDLFDQWG